MSELYIIGNGFDLCNGLKTRYSDFHRFVTGNYPDLENSIEEYFSFETDGHYLWKSFEHDLNTFDHESWFESIKYIDVLTDSFRSCDAFGLEDESHKQAEVGQ